MRPLPGLHSPRFIEVLLCALAAFVGVWLAVPLPKLNGFPLTSGLLLDDPISLLLYVAIGVLILVLWYGSETRPLIAAVVVVLFAVVFFNVWTFRIPGGEFIFGGVNQASVVKGIVDTSHIISYSNSEFPALYLFQTFLGVVGGFSLANDFLLFAIVKPALIALMSFLVIREFVKSPRAAALAVLLSIIADIYLSADSTFDISAYGILIGLVCLLGYAVLLRRPTRSAIAFFLVCLLAAVISYPLTPLVLAGGIFLDTFARRTRLALGGSNLGLPLVVTALVAYAAYGLYYFIEVFRSALGNITFVAHGSGGGSTPHSLTYYLTLWLSADLAGSPSGIGGLTLFWFLLVFGIGTILWLVNTLAKKTRVTNGFVLMSLILGIGLFALGGGSEWVRILPYLGVFYCGIIVAVLAPSRKPFVQISLMILILTLTVPTIVAYYPRISTQDATYDWQFASANFFQSYHSDSKTLVGVPLPFIDYSVASSQTFLIPGVAQTPLEEQLWAEAHLSTFTRAGGYVLSTSILTNIVLNQTFGSQTESSLNGLLIAITHSSDMVYNSRFSYLLVSPG